MRTPVVASLGRDSARDFRADLRRIRAARRRDAGRRRRLRATGFDRCRRKSRCWPPACTTRSTGCRSETRRSPSADWWLDAAAAMIRERRRDLAGVPAIGGRRAARACKRTAARIADAIEQFIDTTELDFLFDRERHLFAIGYNVTEGRRDSTYYDALASEARLASFVAIAMRHVSQEHWFKLGRLDDAGGTASRARVVERIDVRVPDAAARHAQLSAHAAHETYHAVISRHIEYAKAAGIPWGISESAYNVQDAGANYQYRAFGVPGIGLKRGLADDLVVAPYACLLAAPLRPKEVIANLEHLALKARSARWGTTRRSTTRRNASSPGSAAPSCEPTWRTITG